MLVNYTTDLTDNLGFSEARLVFLSRAQRPCPVPYAFSPPPPNLFLSITAKEKT